MQYSKSFAYFALPDQQRQPSTQTRARRRSSLDTFVIPGRTRLPSRKASTLDFQITQGLLNTAPPQPRRGTMTSTEIHEWSPETSPAGCMTRRGANSSSSGPLHHRARPDLVKRPPPRFGGREVIIVPPQRPRPHTHQPALQPLAPKVSQEYVDVETYDGADESNNESRLTSTTWSTVSHRFFSDSSGSSRTMGASYYRDEYNTLADKYGLPQLEGALDQGENYSQTKTTTKTHHAGWLARKLFRRTSSTYTLKAKTTYKPVSKKKSFGGISVLSEDRHKNILKGKSLEELSRLGGLSVLILPPDFAVDKLTLPTCLSATATYLYQHGRNAPGIFRVSGQTTIVNALYDFYDHEFANADAGSPSKVEQTVGSGLLPSHIEHTVPDVASFFKRVLIDLPGGLLGSIELFEALRSITINFAHDDNLSELELSSLKAKMIALAISSVTSDYRLYLIQAVLGLVSYLGHEAQKLQAETSHTDEDQSASELMNYRSLGVVMGPLLLGNLTDRAVHSSEQGQSKDPLTPLETDNGKKFRKHKRKNSDLKLDQNATLAAFVDRANRTAVVMQQLLSIWPEVVKQLREISTAASSSQKSGSRRRLKKMPSHTGSRLTLKTSEEEMRFLDILRGRTLPEEFRGAVRIKSEIRVTSRSPMSRGAIGPSEGGHSNDSCAAASNEDRLSPSSDQRRTAERDARDNELAVSSKLQFIEETKPLLTEEVALGAENRTPSDLAMDKMAMGTILPPLQIPRSSSSHRDYLHLVDPAFQTPENNLKSGSSSETPQTALRDAPLMDHSHESEQSQLQISMRKPLPAIGDAQKAELSYSSSEDMVLEPPSRPFARHERPASPQRNSSSSVSSSKSFSSRQARLSAERAISLQRQSGQFHSPPTKQRDDDATFPPRQSSLPIEQHLPLKSVETYKTLAEYKAKTDAYMSPPRPIVSRKASEIRTERNHVHPKPNNVRALAQRFTEASRAMRKNNEQPNETATPRIYAFVSSLPSPKSSMLGIEDPFVSTESNNVSKESLIPRPIRDVGRIRERRSLSPPKRAVPEVNLPNRRPAFGIGTERDARIVPNKANVSASAEHKSDERQSYDEMNVNSPGIGCSKDLSIQHLDAHHHQRSTESLRRHTSLQTPPNEPHRLHNRTISFVELARQISPSRPDSPSLNVNSNPKHPSPRSNTYLNASDALKPLERHGSINAAMYRRICDLQRQLQQMGEEKEAKDRRIEALEEVQGVNPVAVGVKTRGSFGKGGLHNEVRKAKRELSLWKMRAELAERRLSELKQVYDPPWVSETVNAETTKPQEIIDFASERDGENDLNNVQNSQGHSPDYWKRRAFVAESQLIQIGKRESPKEDFDVHERHKANLQFWKARAIIAETQLGQNAQLIGKGRQRETVRTVPSPTTAKVHVGIETENGEEEVGFWDWRGGNGCSPNKGDDSLTKDEKQAERRAGPVKRSQGSDDESSDFASALNGYG